jgi:hypothetical protein
VDVCRIARTNGPANQEQQAQDGSAADTQPLFRPYDAVKLVAGLSTSKPGDKEQQQQLKKLVSDGHRMKLLIAVGLSTGTFPSQLKLMGHTVSRPTCSSVPLRTFISATQTRTCWVALQQYSGHRAAGCRTSTAGMASVLCIFAHQAY